MLAVIFEGEPHAEYRDAYFDIAAQLKPLLAGIDGFLGIERFESLSTPGKLLSLSWWRDEAAIASWRANAQHRNAQGFGRDRAFRDYRLRIAHVVRDYGLHDRAQAPEDSRAKHG